MTLWELACYFAVFLGGSAGGWAVCALFTWARVAELNGECTRLNLELESAKAQRHEAEEASSRAHLELHYLRDRFRSVLEPERYPGKVT